MAKSADIEYLHALALITNRSCEYQRCSLKRYSLFALLIFFAEFDRSLFFDGVIVFLSAGICSVDALCPFVENEGSDNR